MCVCVCLNSIRKRVKILIYLFELGENHKPCVQRVERLYLLYNPKRTKKLQLEVGGGEGEGKGKEKGSNKNSLINPVSAKRNEARRKHHQQKERNCNKKP